MSRAVVIGASIAGLLAARVLSERFEVTLIDRDELPDQPRPRRGVPQDRHIHVLLSRGREAMEDLLPGLSDDLVARTDGYADVQNDVHWYNDGQLLHPAPSGILALGASRLLLEDLIRRRVLALPNITLRPGREATGLILDGGRVAGVETFGRRERDTATLDADLVVDAAGRGSRTPAWLARLGYPAVPQSEIKVDITYLTRRYRRDPAAAQEVLGVANLAYPGQLHGGGIAVEEDTIALGLQGMLGVVPPADDAGMAEFVAGMASPAFGELIRTGDPVGEPVAMRYPASVRRHYERVRRLPEGHLVLGDALCTFNPIYGQGMTIAALEAVLLRRLLDAGTAGLPRRFFRAAAKLLGPAWSISAGNDLRFPQVPGRRPLSGRLVNRYLGRYHRAATTDPVLGTAFIRVANLIDPPHALLAPRLVLRVLRA
jgi:2-polyprenyl-6-methoxyphenol hydroxylase-like FAD-dependent oxidoreductase